MPVLPVSSLKNGARVFGKYLDQPALVEKLYDAMPAVLTGTAAGYGIYDTYKTSDEQRKKRAIKNASVLGFTVASALLATRGLKIKGKEIGHGDSSKVYENPWLNGYDLLIIKDPETSEQTIYSANTLGDSVWYDRDNAAIQIIKNISAA